MRTYDPLQPTDPQEWLALDEAERIDLVQDYHRRARVKLPNRMAHAAIQTTVENQVAMGDETPVRKAVTRLMGEGLNRHDAIHAVGWVLATHMYNLLQLPRGTRNTDELNKDYFAKVEKLTAQAWLDSVRK